MVGKWYAPLNVLVYKWYAFEVLKKYNILLMCYILFYDKNMFNDNYKSVGIYRSCAIFDKNLCVMKRILLKTYQIYKIRILFLFIFIPLIGIHHNAISQNSSKIDSLELLISSSEGVHKLGLLDQLSQQYFKSNTVKSLEYSKQMLIKSEQSKNYYYLQKAYLNCARSFYFLTKLDSVLYYANRVIKFNDKTKNDTVIANGYMLICNANIIRGNYDVALDNGEKALDNYKIINDTLEMATAQKNISYIFKARGEYEKSLEYALEALKIFELSNDTMRIVSGLGTIANIYTGTGNLKLSLEYFKKARNYLRHHQNTLIYAQVLGGIAGIYRQQRQNDSSLYLYEQALTITKKINNPLLEGKMSMNMANTLKDDKKFKEALVRYNRAKEIFTTINSKKDLNHVLYSLGETYLQWGKYDSAEIYLLKSLKTSKKINSALLFEGSLNQLYLLYEKTQNFKNAYKYYTLYTKYHDSINGENVQVRIAELETKYKTEKKERHIIELEQEKEIQESKALTLKSIIAGVVIIFLLIMIGILLKRKKDKQIYHQKEIVLKKEKQLARSELAKSKIKEKELQQSILYKSKQLSTHALHMMQKNTILQEIQSDIKSISKKATDDDKQNYKRINLKIKQSLSSHKDWDIFKLYFENVNKNFFKKLKEINPHLTTNDHRLCALIKLNMTSKEMASVLNVAPNSIKSSRYRLKKKLGLDIEVDMEEFIRDL